jgi:hypothetical protein
MSKKIMVFLLVLNLILILFAVIALAASLDASSKGMSEPAITWNLFVTLVGIPSLAFYIKYLIKKRDEAIDAKTTEWQTGAKERHNELKTRLDNFETFMREASVELNKKVNTDDCKGLCDEKWFRIYHHKHDSEGNVAVTG